MRFSELTLERYGRFQDCTLRFRPGQPDLHIVYGENETGKSTTLSAVSDLLFGFPKRSPYNFRFDYGLLRIGAVLETDETRFACRRRKADANSLVDADDRPLDEAPLRALLHGQDRERFRLGFSLDQNRLREGGRAMVEAKDDVGQALFAAGSGLTGVTAALAALEAEAKQVWARRGAALPFNVAQRQYEEAQRRLRDSQLKPKAWIDAQADLKRKDEALARLESERAELAQERRRLERLRRIGADVRRREGLRQALEAHPANLWLSAAAEAATQAALLALDKAERDRGLAASLLEELDARLAELQPDTEALAAADAVEALAMLGGAEEKAASDLPRRQAELTEIRKREGRLRAELGGSAVAAPRLLVARLRDLAGAHKSRAAALSENRTASADLQQQLIPLRLELADAAVAEGLSELVAAVDAARALGDDLDARCLSGRATLRRLEARRDAAIARLVPWTGSAAALAAAPVLDPGEIAAADLAARRTGEATETARQQAGAAAEALETLALERRTLAEGGQAISTERVAEARAARDERWTRIEAHLLERAPLTNPRGAADHFSRAISDADRVADQRFLLAEASGKLAALDERAAALKLAKVQAETRAERAEAEAVGIAQAWTRRLGNASLPPLEPAALRGWMDMRREALAAEDEAARAREALELDLDRRRRARARLLTFLPDTASNEDGGETLAPTLAKAAKRRETGEARNRRFVELKTQERGLEDQLAALARRAARLETEQAANHEEWIREAGTASVDLPIEGAEARLAVLDELRALGEEAEALEHRIQGIEHDSLRFAEAVHQLADRLGQDPDADVGRRLDSLRTRLSAARSVSDARREHEVLRQARREELNTAEAARQAALASLAPRALDLGVDDVAALPAALDTSREARRLREELGELERRIGEAGDGYPVPDLAAAVLAEDPDTLAHRLSSLEQRVNAMDAEVTAAADQAGSARQAFAGLETGPEAAEAAADAAIARAEMDDQAETYLLKRSQAIALRWAIDRYRERRQNPLLSSASALFRSLTLDRYSELRIDLDANPPRLLGLCHDGASLVDVEHMSEGTSDQLFLALRLAAVEQAIAGGTRLPFLADDLFVNFDDARASAGLQVLSELAQSTQVLIFTHHKHLVEIARRCTDGQVLSECTLD